jgi:SAM-dependent methyltransferase
LITDLSNKMLVLDNGTHQTVCDGPALGGCGRGEVGDPRTFLPDLWRDVIDRYGVKTVLDVGCGFGYSTNWFDNEGLDAHGLEGSEKIVETAMSASVDVHDFRTGKPGFLRDSYDLGWCSEFLEHVKKEYEPCYMAALVRCKYLLISAALPGFGGHHHVNERPSEHWIERFRDHGFEFLQDETNRLRQLAHDTCPGSYFQANGLFFRRVKDVAVKTHWTDLEGDLMPEIAEAIQDRARGRRVLVVGGDAQIALALGQTAGQVTVVDASDAEVGSIVANSRRAGCYRIEAMGDAIDSPEIAARRFEMAVIGSESAFDGTDLATKTLLPGGCIVWGGWDDHSVRDNVAEAGIDLSHTRIAGKFGFMESACWPTVVCLPHSRGIEPAAYKSVRTASIGRFTSIAAEVDMDCGCLPHNFNALLTHCLNWRDEGKCSHMAMIHSDVSAERGWLDLLAEEMHAHGLIAISAVVAIKDPDNDRTSTAIGRRSDPWEAKRYVHVRDRERMPVTFTSKDVCTDNDEVLLINTGLMLLDLRHEFWDTFAFEVPTAILRKEGKRFPIFRPEDWEMSRALDRAGLPYGATWRPLTDHHGSRPWTNRQPLVQVIPNA